MAMVAVFGLKEDFVRFRSEKEQAGCKELYKLVTENIQKDFCGYNVDGVEFLPNYWRAYPNLLRMYVETQAYIRGPRSMDAQEKLKRLIEVERILERLRVDMCCRIV